MVIDTEIIKTQVTAWTASRIAEIDSITTKIKNVASGDNVDLLPKSLRKAYTAQNQSKVELQETKDELIELVEKVEHIWTMLGN